jgi:zinc protease
MAMTGMVAIAFCQTAIQSAFAIGGVDTPPPPSASLKTRFVAPKETRLENGLRVIVAERPELPLLSAEVLIGQGAAADPAGLAGTALLTGELLTKGTETMTASQIANAIESLGGSIGSGAGRETSAAYVQVLSGKAETALRILADVVQHPAFRQEEINRLRNQRLDYLRVVLQQPGSLPRFVTERSYLARAPGHATGGTLETVQKISRQYCPYIGVRAENAAFILAGDITWRRQRHSPGIWQLEERRKWANENQFRRGELEA